MTDQTEPPEGGTTDAQFDHDRVEEIIDIVEDDLDSLEEEVPEDFEADVEDIEDRLDDIDNAIDDAQDGEGENPLGPVPAQLDYVQRVAEIVEEKTDLDSADAVEKGLESLEDAVDGVEVDQTAWFALVDGIPEVYESQVVTALDLKQQGDVQGSTDEFAVKAVPSSSADLSDAEANFPEDGQEVDLEKFRYFLTEKTEGGVV